MAIRETVELDVNLTGAEAVENLDARLEAAQESAREVARVAGQISAPLRTAGTSAETIAKALGDGTASSARLRAAIAEVSSGMRAANGYTVAIATQIGRANTSVAALAGQFSRLNTAARGTDAEVGRITAALRAVGSAVDGARNGFASMRTTGTNATAALRAGLAQVTTETDRATRSSRGLGISLRQVATVLVTGFAGRELFGFFAGAVREAAGLVDQANALNVVFGEAGAAATQFAAAQQAIGLSTVQASQGLTLLGSVFVNAGKSQTEAVTTAEALVERAGDIASVFGKTAPEAINAFTSALRGETEPIRKFGVDVSEAAIKAELLAQGVEAVGGQFTVAQSQIAIADLILKQTNNSAGDFANTLETSLVNQVARTGAEFANFKGRLGEGLQEPLIELLRSVRTNVLPGLEAELPRLVAAFGDAIPSITAALQTLVEALPDIVTGAAKLVEILASGAPIVATFASALASIAEALPPGVITGLITLFTASKVVGGVNGLIGGRTGAQLNGQAALGLSGVLAGGATGLSSGTSAFGFGSSIAGGALAGAAFGPGGAAVGGALGLGVALFTSAIGDAANASRAYAEVVNGLVPTFGQLGEGGIAALTGTGAADFGQELRASLLATGGNTADVIGRADRAGVDIAALIASAISGEEIDLSKLDFALREDLASLLNGEIFTAYLDAQEQAIQNNVALSEAERAIALAEIDVQRERQDAEGDQRLVDATRFTANENILLVEQGQLARDVADARRDELAALQQISDEQIAAATAGFAGRLNATAIADETERAAQAQAALNREAQINADIQRGVLEVERQRGIAQVGAALSDEGVGLAATTNLLEQNTEGGAGIANINALVAAQVDVAETTLANLGDRAAALAGIDPGSRALLAEILGPLPLGRQVALLATIGPKAISNLKLLADLRDEILGFTEGGDASAEAQVAAGELTLAELRVPELSPRQQRRAVAQSPAVTAAVADLGVTAGSVIAGGTINQQVNLIPALEDEALNQVRQALIRLALPIDVRVRLAVDISAARDEIQRALRTGTQFGFVFREGGVVQGPLGVGVPAIVGDGPGPEAIVAGYHPIDKTIERLRAVGVLDQVVKWMMPSATYSPIGNVNFAGSAADAAHHFGRLGDRMEIATARQTRALRDDLASLTATVGGLAASPKRERRALSSAGGWR